MMTVGNLSRIGTRRREGHIEMSTNHRTLPRLMNTMNLIFRDTFSDRHHLLPGPWHAEPQDLTPSRKSPHTSKLEWVLPTRTGSGQKPLTWIKQLIRLNLKVQMIES